MSTKIGDKYYLYLHILSVVLKMSYAVFKRSVIISVLVHTGRCQTLSQETCELQMQSKKNNRWNEKTCLAIILHYLIPVKNSSFSFQIRKFKKDTCCVIVSNKIFRHLWHESYGTSTKPSAI